MSNSRFSKGAPAIVSPNPGVIRQFMRGYDDQLWMLRGDAWVQLSGTLASSPTAFSPYDDRVDVLMLGTDAHVYHCEIHGAATTCGATGGGYDDNGGAPRGSFVGEPVMTADGGDKLDYFVRGSDNTLWHRAWRWGWEARGWENLEGYIISSPAATSRDGRIDVAAVGYDGAIWHMSRANDSAPWSAWKRLPGDIQFTTAPAIVAPNAGELNVYAVDPSTVDGQGKPFPQIKQNLFRGGAWSGWNSITAPMPAAAAAPPAAAVVRGGSSVRITYRAVNGSVYATDEANAFVKAPDLGVWSDRRPVTNFDNFALGHFLPKGRMQAITYRLDFGGGGSTKKLVLDAYKFSGGSLPEKIGSSLTFELFADATNPYWFHDAVGDFDGDGAEELALTVETERDADLYIFQLTGDGTLEGQKRESIVSNTDISYVRLVSGNFKDDVPADDEIAAFYSTSKCVLKVYDFTEAGTKVSVTPPREMDCQYNSDRAVAAGNFISEPSGSNIIDEIAYTGIYADTGDWFPGSTHEYFLKTYLFPKVADAEVAPIQRDLEVQDIRVGIPKPDKVPYWISIAGADLDRSGRDEIAILMERHKTYDQPTNRYIYTFQVAGAAITDYVPVTTIDGPPGSDSITTPAALVSGNLYGAGLRLAKPTYRLVKNLGQPVAWVNAPPKLYDADYVNPDTSYIGDPHVINPDSHAVIESESTKERAIEVEAKSHWGLETNISGEWGTKAASVKASLNASVGADFSKVNTSTRGTRYTVAIDSKEDQILNSLTDFKLYEYPVVDGADYNVLYTDLMFMAVTMPSKPAEDATRMDVRPTSYCGVVFNPGHDQSNLLSYPELPEELPGYDPDKVLAPINTYTGDTNRAQIDLAVNRQDVQKRSQTTKWSVSIGVEGKLKALGGKISAGIKGDYAGEHAASETVTIGESIKIGGALEPIKPMPGEASNKYTHHVTPVFYWVGDTVVLNYATQPGPSTWWTTGADADGWLKPDPAFVRPWKGLSCEDAQGRSQDDFSPEVIFDNSTPMIGETVTVTATVRNFSDTAVQGVAIRFYNGDPASGGTEISCNPAQPNVTLQKRGKTEVSCRFTATGIGDQRICVVADPANVKSEHYEDNNKAFGILTVTQPYSASGADPGLIAEKAGKLFVLDTVGSKQTSLFVPYTAMAERAVTSFKLEPSALHARAFTVSNMSVDSNTGAWTSVPATFGLDKNLVRDYAIPTAWVQVEYSDTDFSPADEDQLGLFRFDKATQTWEDETTLCKGKIVIDPAHNVLQAPVCRTGAFALYPLPNEVKKVYLPFVKK